MLRYDWTYIVMAGSLVLAGVGVGVIWFGI